MSLQRSAIFKPVDQMRWNKRQWEAYKKSILTKQSKQESNENEKLTKAYDNQLNKNLKRCLAKNFYKKGPHYLSWENQ